MQQYRYNQIHNRQTKPAGLTLIELLLAMGIFSIIALVAVAMFANGFRSWRSIQEHIRIQAQVRSTLQTMVKEMREAKTADNGAYAIESAQNQTLIFFANVDTDALTERVRYFYQSNKIQRGVIKPTGTPVTYPAGNETVTDVISNVTLNGDMFSYFDQTYTGTQAALTFPVNAQSVHLVAIRFFVDINPLESPTPVEFSTQATLRNEKKYAPD